MEVPSKYCQRCSKEYFKPYAAAYHRWEGRRYCSKECGDKSKKTPWLIKHQIKPGQHASPNTQFKKGDNTGNKNPRWTDKPSYNAIHLWVALHFGKPQECEHCGTSEKRMYHWANKSGNYLRDRDDWFRLCVPCHRKFDYGKRKDHYA